MSQISYSKTRCPSPACRREFAFDVKFAGKTATCKGCGTNFILSDEVGRKQSHNAAKVKRSQWRTIVIDTIVPLFRASYSAVGQGRRRVIIAFVVLFVAPLGALMSLNAKWLLMQWSHAAHIIGAAAAGFLVFAIIAHALAHRIRHGQSHSADASHATSVGGSHTWRWCGVAALAGLAVGGEMAVHFAATEIHHHMAEALPAANQLYVNHDVAKLVGETLGVMTLKAGEEENDPDTRASFTAIAAVVPEEWLKLASAHDPRVIPLTEKELWVFVQNPGTPALDSERWEELVTEWSAAAHVSPLAPESRRRLIDELIATFAFAWREALKHDYTHNGKATEAMHLDLFGELLRRSSEGASQNDPTTKEAIARLSDIPTQLRAIAERVRSQGDGHAREVMARFDSVDEMLAQAVASIGTVRNDVAEVKTNTVAIRDGVESIRNTVQENTWDIKAVRKLLQEIRVTRQESQSPTLRERVEPEAIKAIQGDYQAYLAQRLAGGSLPFFKANAPLRYRAWLRVAEAGNAMAQVLVGRALQEGTGVTQNLEDALKWYERAADQGDPAGLFMLGAMHEDGIGGAPKSDVNASRLWLAAAERGSVAAMTALGDYYRWGKGELPEDKELALKWYKQASEKGDTNAMLIVAQMYTQGEAGLTVDKAKAGLLYKRAAAAGNDVAKGMLTAQSIGQAFAAYTALDATASARSRSLNEARQRTGELASIGAEGLIKIMSDGTIRTAIDRIRSATADDPMREVLDVVIDNAIKRFMASDQNTRVRLIDEFAQVTADEVRAWAEAGDHHRVVAIWKACYKGVNIREHTNGDQEEMVGQLTAIIGSLYATGYRMEASRLADDTFSMCDAILAERPWDWYVKTGAMRLAWEAGQALTELGDLDKAQVYLRRAWRIAFAMYGREDSIDKYTNLPLKGNVPENAKGSDREFFAYFAPNSKSQVYGMTRFTVPVEFAGTRYPFHVFVVSGKRGYSEIQDQFLWVKENRGGFIPREVEDSFRKLNKIAVERNVEFRDLALYAIGKDSMAKEVKSPKDKN
ncbi:MAG: DUF2610 domain-containing protein [Planctomycetes bacterium]|jgi:TPR repeat protein|nr:DUF2610 domain-containing protein [Planctomycetota bacterium]OQZ05829.1 MAG: hypothetical protein B6D36_08125 [Planctomycetes bacterium UTPLA1]